MTSENEKKELKHGEGSKELEQTIKTFHDSLETLDSFISDAAYLREHLQDLKTIESRALSDSMTAFLPSLQELARSMAVIDRSVYSPMSQVARMAASMNDLQRHMMETASIIRNANVPYVQLANGLSRFQESLKALDVLSVSNISLDHLVIAARNNNGKRVEALEKALVRLENELTERDAIIEELMQIIEELKEKNKLDYAV